MDPYGPSSAKIRQFSGNMLQTKLEPYKVDEGYSEDTRSSDGSESAMRLDLQKGGEEMMQPPLSANLENLIRGLSEYERGGMCLERIESASNTHLHQTLHMIF